ncbi:MAG: MalY/PatB family protein [Planctomycetota bacterium]|jgi:cystathionine beta-lyase
MVDLESVIERRGTHTYKWNHCEEGDVIAMTVADMDFASPPAVLDAIRRRLDHPILGYGMAPPQAVEAVQGYLQREYDWAVAVDELIWIPGLVSGLCIACRASTGKDVLTLSPVYPPFLQAPKWSEKRLIDVPLACQDEVWSLDLARIEESITDETKLLLLCSPHNPVGRAFTEKELRALAELCLERGITLCSDEIHCDLILDENRRHIPTATLSPEIRDATITLMAPSKTYNVPGMGCSFAVIPNKRLRLAFKRAMQGIVPHINVLAWPVLTAVYTECREWHDELLTTLRWNRDLLEERIGDLHGVAMAHVEATYLAWINIAALGLKDPYQHFFDHGIELSDGRAFGHPDYLRLNFGCPRATLTEALRRFEAAVHMRPPRS